LPGDDSKLDNSSSPRSQRKAARGNGMIVENAAPWVLRQVEQWQWTPRDSRYRTRDEAVEPYLPGTALVSLTYIFLRRAQL
jgi:hypothetical protein